MVTVVVGTAEPVRELGIQAQDAATLSTGLYQSIAITLDRMPLGNIQTLNMARGLRRNVLRNVSNRRWPS